MSVSVSLSRVVAACCGRCRRCCWRDGQNNVSDDDAGPKALAIIIVEHGDDDARRTNVIGILDNLALDCLFIFDIASVADLSLILMVHYMVGTSYHVTKY